MVSKGINVMNEENTSAFTSVKRPECSKLWEIPSVLANFETLRSISVRQETWALETCKPEIFIALRSICASKMYCVEVHF